MTSTGTIGARYAYDPYGRQSKLAGSSMSTFQYAGYYLHSASRLNLTKYRAYDTSTGRWLSRDPIEERGGIDLYNYVLDEPINYVDRLGLAPRNTIPPANRTPMPADSNNKLPPIPVPKQPLDVNTPPENVPESAAAAASIAADGLSAIDYWVQIQRGMAMCNKVAHSQSGHCKCCVLSMFIQISGEYEVYSEGRGTVYDMPCDDAQKKVESTRYLTRPGIMVFVAQYIDW